MDTPSRQSHNGSFRIILSCAAFVATAISALPLRRRLRPSPPFPRDCRPPASVASADDEVSNSGPGYTSLFKLRDAQRHIVIVAEYASIFPRQHCLHLGLRLVCGPVGYQPAFIFSIFIPQTSACFTLVVRASLPGSRLNTRIGTPSPFKSSCGFSINPPANLALSRPERWCR